MSAPSACIDALPYGVAACLPDSPGESDVSSAPNTLRNGTLFPGVCRCSCSYLHCHGLCCVGHVLSQHEWALFSLLNTRLKLTLAARCSLGSSHVDNSNTYTNEAVETSVTVHARAFPGTNNVFRQDRMSQYHTMTANAMEHAIVPIAQMRDLPSIQFSSCACKYSKLYCGLPAATSIAGATGITVEQGAR